MMSSRWALCSLLVGLVTATASADELTTSGGKKITGKIVSVDAQGVTFSANEAQVKIPGKDIVVVDLGNKVVPLQKDKSTGQEPRITDVELTDGSTFRTTKFALKAKKVQVELFPGPAGVAPPAFELPMTSLFTVIRDAADAKNREAWKKLLAGRGKRDLYVIREAEALNFVQGTILSGNDEGTDINFEKEDNTQITLRQSRAGGFVFAQPQPKEVAKMICKVHDVFGNVLIAQSIDMTSSGMAVKTVAGVTVTYPSLSAVAKLDYAQGNVAYLSDLEPRVDAPEPSPDEKGLRVNLAAPYLRDRGLADEPLRLGNDYFTKGLLVAPDTALTYNINGDYREFKAMLGLPESTPDGNLEAKVTIETDGRVLFSETIKRKDKPKSVSLDVKGVKQLRLIVEAEFAVNGNRVLFGEALVQK